MQRDESLWTLGTTLLVIVVTISGVAPDARAQGKYKVLHRFTLGDLKKDRADPVAGLVFDQEGNLYGTTVGADISVSGTVFKLTHNSDGSWSERVIYSFCSLTNCSDGAGPDGRLIFDSAGNLYGTTLSGGDADSGVVFKLTPNPNGNWSESAIYRFAGGQDGSEPDCALIFDQAGNLYGTTALGGTSYYYGTVFKLTPNPNGSWTESVLHSFSGQDGGVPHGGVIFDQAGNLYGTTAYSGYNNSSYGVVFRLTPHSDGSWTESVLHAFTGGKDGGGPNSALIIDRAGNLYGTATIGGNLTLAQCNGYGCGVVFRLTPNSDESWSESVLHTFSGGSQGIYPDASVIFDSSGNLYGTTVSGGDLNLCKGLIIGCGVVFKLAPNGNGRWTEKVLHRFYDHPGANPYAGVIFDPAGNLYGTTFGDQTTTFGSVFQITP